MAPSEDLNEKLQGLDKATLKGVCLALGIDEKLCRGKKDAVFNLIDAKAKKS